MKYSELLTPTSIRILQLYPGKESEPLRSTLFTIDLDSGDTDFVAISYAWGDPTLSKVIECNGEQTLITSNLDSALRRLRNEEKHGFCWADALCIDQSDQPEALRERAAQVRLMNKIFASALFVVVDLGGLPDCYKEFKHLCFLVDIIHPSRWAEIEKRLGQGDTVGSFAEFENLSSTSIAWHAWNSLMTRSYFRRVWVVQEYVVARDLRIAIGNDLWPFNLFENVTRRIHTLCHHVTQEPRLTTGQVAMNYVMITTSMVSWLRTRRWRQAYHQGDAEFGIDQLLVAGLELDATDPRDRIFALHGLADKRFQQEVGVDYTSSVDALSVKVSKYMVSQTQGELVLALAAGAASQTPSWCIKLDLESTVNVDRPQSTLLLALNYQIYSAGGPSSPVFSLDENPLRLSVSGCLLDVITNATGVCPLQRHRGLSDIACETDIESYTQETVDWNKEVTLWLMKFLEHLPFNEALDILWRTMISDKVIGLGVTRDGRAEASFFHNYMAWLTQMRVMDKANGVPGAQDFTPKTNHSPQQTIPFWTSLVQSRGKRFAGTSQKMVGLLPGEAQIGDHIFICAGLRTPLVVRDRGNGCYCLVGSGYVHNMMDGQALRSDRWAASDILLV